MNNIGVVTAVAKGNVTIKATTADGNKIDSCLIAVSAPVKISSIVLTSKGNVNSLKAGSSLQFTATFNPADASNKVLIWSVLPGTGDANINGDGLLIGAFVGTVTVKAAATDGSGVSATYNLNIVEDPTITFIYFEGNNSWPVVSFNDLLQTSASVTAKKGSFENELRYGIRTLTDGVIGSLPPKGAAIDSNSSLTYTLNTTVNTKGYNISAINVYTSWPDQGRINPNVGLSYSLIGSPATFVKLGTMAFNASVRAGLVAPWTKSMYIGPIPPGVAAVKFDFGENGGENAWIGYSEIDVMGAPTQISALKNTTVSQFSTNATNGELHLNFGHDVNNALITIFDVKGQQMLTKNVNGLTTTLGIQNLSKGVYIVKLLNEGKTQTAKFVK